MGIAPSFPSHLPYRIVYLEAGGVAFLFGEPPPVKKDDVPVFLKKVRIGTRVGR
jgi:hypothetical protein